MTRCASALRFVDPHYLRWDERGHQLKLSRRHAKVVEAIAGRLAASDIARTPKTVEFHMLRHPDLYRKIGTHAGKPMIPAGVFSSD